ncbi:hypothetical protein [Sporichthya polymorpha]|uniref:hypothetical protein n=1 Tax=Sporichthya polymorpha TaxID=35751 RepID=UPI00036B3F5F|nr:hypothetical protein [Sporichthya polymorpha]
MKPAGEDGGANPSAGPLDVPAMIFDARRHPRLLVVAALAQALQALALLGVGVVTLVVGITGGGSLVDGLLVGALATGGGVGLLAVARGLLGAQGWSRAPALVWQLITLPIAFTTMDDLPAAGYALLTSAIVILAALFAPSTGAALQD